MLNTMKDEKEEGTVAEDFKTGESMGQKDTEEDKNVADTSTSDEKSV